MKQSPYFNSISWSHTGRVNQQPTSKSDLSEASKLGCCPDEVSNLIFVAAPGFITGVALRQQYTAVKIINGFRKGLCFYTRAKATVQI